MQILHWTGFKNNVKKRLFRSIGSNQDLQLYLWHTGKNNSYRRKEEKSKHIMEIYAEKPEVISRDKNIRIIKGTMI